VAGAWLGGSLSVGLLWGQFQLRVLHPYGLVFLALVIVTFAMSLGALVRGLWRLVRGPRRAAALALTAVGVVPAGLWVGLGWYALHQWQSREVPHNFPFVVVTMAGASLMEIEATSFSPHRLETVRLVMFYDDGVADPQGDAEEMDRHVAALEEKTGLPLRTRIHWVRGSLLGQGRLAYYGLALGSTESPRDWKREGYLDRHELAHAVLYQHYEPDTDPPTLLSEGWAESQSHDSRALARQALSHRRFLADWGPRWGLLPPSEKADLRATLMDARGMERLLTRVAEEGEVAPSLPELTGPFWYHRDTGPVYPVGGAFVDFLLRRYGTRRFLDLYFSCRPGTFAAECRRVYGTDLATLESQLWEDAERLAGERPRP
jgi:hypothetical protein